MADQLRWVPEWLIDILDADYKRSLIDKTFHHCNNCNGLSSFNKRLTGVFYCRWCGQP